MRRALVFNFILVGFVLAVMLTTYGCVKKKNPDDDGGDDGDPDPRPTAAAVLEAPLDGKVTGTVTYDGAAPAIMFDERLKTKDKQCCWDTADPFNKQVQTWIVDQKTKSVANVLIVLKPSAKNTLFDVKKAEVEKLFADKQIAKIVEIDQPHCTFIPRVVSLFPSYTSGEDTEKTGQTFVVKNNSTVQHNTKITGADAAYENSDSDRNIGPTADGKKGSPIPFIHPQPTPLSVGCSIHTFMSAKIWAFGHPYHRVTPNSGKFDMSYVPTGVKLDVMVWHEANSTVKRADGTAFKYDGHFHVATMEFKKGDNSLNLKISSK